MSQLLDNNNENIRNYQIKIVAILITNHIEHGKHFIFSFFFMKKRLIRGMHVRWLLPSHSLKLWSCCRIIFSVFYAFCTKIMWAKWYQNVRFYLPASILLPLVLFRSFSLLLSPSGECKCAREKASECCFS